MIRCTKGPDDTGEIVIDFPEYAEKVDGKRVVPQIVLDRPTTPSRRASEIEAWRMVPTPDQDESDEDFAVRAAPIMEALGFSDVVRRAGLQSGIHAAAQTLELVKLVQLHIRSWTGFGDDNGHAFDEPTGEAVLALIVGNPVIARKIERKVNEALGRVAREGNG